MIYREFRDLKLSALGFGTMRLPLLEGGAIDEAQTMDMVRYAMEHGINYFDTAYPYHSGLSEVVLGKALKEFPRESFYLADKYPGHQIASTYDPAAVFEEQLQKCGVEYFDFYLLHNVYENSIKTYLDPQWGMVDYFVEQKRLGRIRYLGFSTHGSVETMKEFLDVCGDKMDFCQIQLNYLDWTLQDAKGKYDLLEKWGLPIIVMEPIRGGKLAKLDEAAEAKLKALRPDESIPAWALRWLQELPNVKVVLSGMSSMDQMVDNVKTYEAEKPLTEEEHKALAEIAEGLKSGVPCTACRYCCDGCPMGLDIPMLLQIYNDICVTPSFTVGMRAEALPKEKQPAACIGCGACEQICPQNIKISEIMKDCADRLEKIPKWETMCREREEAAARLRAAQK